MRLTLPQPRSVVAVRVRARQHIDGSFPGLCINTLLALRDLVLGKRPVPGGCKSSDSTLEKGLMEKVWRIFFLDIPDDVAVERLSERMTDPVTGERYHSIYKPAPSLEVQVRLQQNPLDSSENVEMGLQNYHANVQDLEEFYDGVIHINADQDPNTIFEYIESCVIHPLSKTGPKDITLRLSTAKDVEPAEY